jgi:hypothetical protein
MAANTWLWTVAAVAALAWVIIAIVVAAVGPSEYVPRIFQNYHVEHFAAFYILAVVAAAALPRAGLDRIGLGVAILATVLAGFRMFIPHHQAATAEDLVADLSGAIAALAPIMVGRFRQIAAQTADRGR